MRKFRPMHIAKKISKNVHSKSAPRRGQKVIFAFYALRDCAKGDTHSSSPLGGAAPASDCYREYKTTVGEPPSAPLPLDLQFTADNGRTGVRRERYAES
jgi:hypothetical protein